MTKKTPSFELKLDKNYYYSLRQKNALQVLFQWLISLDPRVHGEFKKNFDALQTIKNTLEKDEIDETILSTILDTPYGIKSEPRFSQRKIIAKNAGALCAFLHFAIFNFYQIELFNQILFGGASKEERPSPQIILHALRHPINKKPLILQLNRSLLYIVVRAMLPSGIKAVRELIQFTEQHDSEQVDALSQTFNQQLNSLFNQEIKEAMTNAIIACRKSWARDSGPLKKWKVLSDLQKDYENAQTIETKNDRLKQFILTAATARDVPIKSKKAAFAETKSAVAFYKALTPGIREVLYERLNSPKEECNTSQIGHYSFFKKQASVIRDQGEELKKRI